MNQLIQKALVTLTKDERLKKFATTKMIDSTNVSMCLTFFDWAEFRSTKTGIKMHTSKEIYFASHLKDNAKLTDAEDPPITYSSEENDLLLKDSKIVFDKKVRLDSQYINLTKQTYRIIKIIDPNGKELTFVTNLMTFSSEEIAWLYKRR